MKVRKLPLYKFYSNSICANPIEEYRFFKILIFTLLATRSTEQYSIIYTIYTISTIYMIYTISIIYMIYTLSTIYMIYTLSTIYTIYTLSTIYTDTMSPPVFTFSTIISKISTIIPIFM